MSDDFYLREIAIGDVTSKLSLGSEEFTPLKIFLKNSALDFHQHNIAKTYVLVDKNSRIWGYASLMSSEITLDILQRPNETQHVQKYNVFPAIKIARLAIDKELRGKGYGLSLLDYCITMVRQLIVPYVGCRFLVVDSKLEAVGFYEKTGFVMVDSEKNKKSHQPAMFLDLNKIVFRDRKLLSENMEFENASLTLEI